MKLPISQEDADKIAEFIRTIRIDALMALDGEWDRSDDGFKSQISYAEETMDRLGIEYE